MEHAYETLAYAGRLSFRDPHGIEALFESYEQLRVHAPELFCVSRRVWGDGNQLAEFVTAAGTPNALHETDRRQLVVTSLHVPQHAGDVVDVLSIRHISHAFKGHREWWEFMAFTPTDHARIAIDFPIGREPEELSVSGQTGSPSPRVFRPATKALVVRIDQPVVGSLYRVEWSW